jgi:hypothetical protein
MDQSENGCLSVKEVTKKCKVNTLICADEVSAYGKAQEYKNIDSISSIDYGDLYIEILHQGKEQAVYISYSGSSVLIVDGFMDFEKMPEKYLSTNLLILDDSIPYNINSIKTQEAIVCTYNQKYKNYMVEHMIDYLEQLRQKYLETNDKAYWKEIVRWLPESWLQTRTVTMNYENILSMVHQREHHKLTEWSGSGETFTNESFIKFAKALPYMQDFLIAAKPGFEM